MATVYPVVRLKLVVRFREFPFGTANDPSLREFTSAKPWENQEHVLAYLRSGLIFGLPMGGGVRDHLDPSDHANPVVDGRRVAGLTEMTDGEWFWHAALIHFVEKYNLRLPMEFVEHAAGHGWRVNRDALPVVQYEWSYWDQ